MTGNGCEGRECELHWSDEAVVLDPARVGEVIEGLREAVRANPEMRAAGVVLVDPDGVMPNRAVMVTRDPALAEQLGFEIVG